MRVRKTGLTLSALVLGAVLVLAGLTAPSAWALDAGASYTVTLHKLLSDGTLEEISSTTVTADANGKIEFSLTNLPTNEETNFLVLTVTDSNDEVVRRGFAPAPPAGATTETGINTVSTSQAEAIIAVAELAGSDDPWAMAYLLVLTRAPSLEDSDIEALASLGQNVILGENGMLAFLRSQGVTASQLETLKEKLVYNSAEDSRDLSDFTAMFKNAVDQDDNEAMAKAGGFMAEVFLDAAVAAGVDPGLILAAHQKGGEVVEGAGIREIVARMSETLQRSMEQSMSAFHTRLAAMLVQKDYTNALNILEATGDQVDRFLAAVRAMIQGFEAIDAQYAEYWMNPDEYVQNHNTTHEEVQQALGQAHEAVFQQFMTNIQATDADIAAMRTAIAQSQNMNEGDLPPDLGTFRDFNGQVLNWPIPEVVLHNWVAAILSAGGNLEYTRDTLPVPPNMGWLNQGTGERTDFVNQFPPEAASFAALMGLREDIEIIEFTRYMAWENVDPATTTQEEMMQIEREARILFEQRLAQAAGRIGGTTDGQTPISTAQKKAIIKLMIQPSLH